MTFTADNVLDALVRSRVAAHGMTFATDTMLTAVCCRAWPVLPFATIGRCGLCGERPVVYRYETIQVW